MTRQQAERFENKWTQWLESKEGKKAMEPSILNSDRQLEFLKNRLWWAFHAGNQPITGKLLEKKPSDDAIELLQECLQKQIPAYLRHKIKKLIGEIKVNPSHESKK